MIKRTLWYACLILLFCSAGALVVMATSAGKTTLLSDSGRSITANPVIDVYLGAVNPEIVTDAPTKETESNTAQLTPASQSAATDIQKDATETTPEEIQPVPNVAKDAVPEAKSQEEARDLEHRNAEILIKNAETLQEEAAPEEIVPVEEILDLARRNTDMMRKSIEQTAIDKGMDPNLAAAKTDADLFNFIGVKEDDHSGHATLDDVTPETSLLPDQAIETAKKELDQLIAAQAAEAELLHTSIFEAYPEFTTAGESAGAAVSGEAEEILAPVDDPISLMEKHANELIGKDQAGESLTPAEKTIIATYARTHFTPSASRGRDNLDDNGGTTYVYSGATLRVPPGTGTGGGTDTTFAPITVSGSGGPILDVEIEIDSLTHEFMGDVDIYLRSPSGTRCELSTDNGGYDESYYARVRFDDDATTNINTVTTAPIIGTYKPEGLLSVFDNESANGEWNLIVYDDASTDFGYLYSWRIQILTMSGLYANDYMTSAISSPAAGTTYAPSSSVTVTATFMNYGSTQQPCSVKYQFNGGSVEAEVTASLVQYATENHSFATQITMPATPGDYELVVWSALATDQDLTNDTLRRTVHVDYDGFTCATAITFSAAGPDSATFNNTGAGDNTPGLPCYTTCYSDMVFKMVIPNGEQGEIWKAYSSALDFTQAFRWGGTCPGTNFTFCWDTPDYRKFRYVNFSGSDQTIYFTGGGYSTTGTGNFRMAWWRQPATIYTAPYTSSFEITVSATVPYYTTLPNFWSVENSNADNLYTWENYNSGAAHGTYCARAYAGSAIGNDDWLFSPGIILSNGQTYYLDYFRKAYSTSIPESLEVKIGTQNASSAMTQTIMAWDTFRINTWVEKGAAFTVSAPDTYFIGFHSYTRRSGGGCYLDSVRVLLDECSAPTVTANAASGTTSATLTSTVSGGHGGDVKYQWFTGEGCINGNQIAYANSATYIALASGIYSLRAWRVDSTNCASCDSALATVTSPCVAQTIPYIDNFDDVTATALPACWIQESTDGVSPVWATNTTNPMTSPNAAYILGSTNGNNDWLFTEPLSLTGGTTYVFQYWRRAYSGTYADCVQVKYGTAPVSSAMLTTIHGPDTCKTSTIYVKKAGLFTPATTGTYYVGINSLTKSSSAGTRLDSVHVYEYGLACGAPSVTVNAGSSQYSVTLTANVSGGFGGPYIYQWYTGQTCTAGNEITGANGPKYTAWAAGIYACRVYCGADSVNCSACDSANVVLTCASPAAPPLTQNFDGVTAPALPTCWTYEDGNANSVYWRTSTTYKRTGTNSVYIYGSTTQNDWLYTTGLSLTGGTTYWVDYFRYNSSTTYADCLEVKYGSLPGSAYMTTSIMAPDTNKTNLWKYKGASFTPSVTGTYYIGFHSLSTSSSAYTYIDDINVYANNACSAPSVTVNAGTGAYSFSLTANVIGGYGGPYYYQWFTGENCVAGNEISGATGSTYTAWASGIYSCQAGCGPAGVCVACDSANVVLTCTTPTVPMVFQNFDVGLTVPALPTCWTQENTNGDANTWKTYTSGYRSSPNCAYITYNSSLPMDDWLFTQGLQLSSDSTYVIDYWYRSYGSTTLPDCMEVKIGTLPGSSSMTTPLRAPMQLTSSTYQNDVLTFIPPSTGLYFVGWHGMSRANAWQIYLDDIRIYAQGECGAPTSVTINSGISGDSLVMTATTVGGWGGTLTYQWFTGLSCQSGNEITGATNASYTATASGIYSVKAYFTNPNSCAACDSANVIIIDCSNRYTPLSEGFETVTVPNLPICWSKESFNAPSDDWMTSTTYPHLGTKSAYISWDGSLPLDDWLYTIGLNLSADTTYRLKYYYRAYSSSYTERMEVSCGRVATRDSMIYSLVPAFNFTNTVYDSQEVPFTPPATGRYFFGFHAMSIANQDGFFLDDIMVWATGTCSAPTTVTVNAATGQDSVKLKATATGGTGGSYQYQWYTGINCQTGSEIVGATRDSLWVSVSGSYSCKVWIFADSCSRCDSGYADVINCAIPLTVPFNQNFDLVTSPVLPPCWAQQNVNADALYWQTSTSYYRSAPNSAWIRYTSSGTGPENDWLFSRAFSAAAGDSIAIDYWYRMAWSSQSYTESLELYAGTAANAASMTIQLEAPYSFNNITYLERIPLFIVPTTGTYYIGWHAISSENQGGISVDDISIRTYGSCTAPDSVRVNAAVGTLYAKLTAAVYGGFGCNVQYQWYTGENCQSGNAITGANAVDYYATSGGVYSVKAWYCSTDTCAACDSAMVTINPDSCAPTSFINEGFESTTGSALPSCWSKQDLNYTSGYWSTTTTTPHSGLRDVYMYGYAPTYWADDWMFTSPIVLQGGVEYTLYYWRRNSSGTYADSLEIMYGTIPLNVFMTDVVAAADTNKTTTWVSRTETFTPAATDTYYVGFHCMNRHYSSSAYTYLDDIMVYRSDTCVAPVVTANAAAGSIYAKLTATAIGGTGTPTYQWFTGQTCEAGNEITGATSLEYYALASGIYSFKASIGTGCSACDSAAATVTPDPCSAATPPVLQYFDGVTAPALPTCWMQENINNDSYYWKTYTSGYRSYPNCAYISYNSSAPMNDYLYSPKLNLTADSTYIIEYWYKSYGSTSLPDCMEVKIGNLPAFFAQTTTLKAPWQLTSSTYQMDTLSFTPTTSGSYYVGWHGISRANAWYIYLDDVKIYKRGDCLAPDSVLANAAVGTMYAKLTANAYGGLGAYTYQWYTGETCLSGNEITGATAKDYYALASGVYSVKVTTGTNCSLCDSAEATVNPDSCGPTAFLSEGFEGTTGSALPPCWSKQDLNYTSNYWSTTTTTPHSGLRNVYMYGYSPTYWADDWMFTASMELQGGVEYTLDYWRRNSSGTYADSLEIMYGTIPLNLYMTDVIAAADTNKTTTWVSKTSNFTPAATDTYYIGFHCMNRHSSSSAYTYLDDIMVYRADTCAAPTVTVADSTARETVTLKAATSGGIGLPLVFQWYTGGICDEANRIDGANTSSYVTTTSGTFSCRVYRRDSTICAACDSGVATVLPPLPGEHCTNPIVITPPAPLGFTQLIDSVNGYITDRGDTCDYSTSSPDVFYSLTLSSCRRITVSVDTSAATSSYGDMHVSMYESGNCAAGPAFLCNDDQTYFTALSWEGTGQRPTYSSGSFIGGELPSGTYYIRVSRYSGTTGSYKITVYDNGACPCEITCQGGDVAEVTESRYDTTFYRTDPDGGCGVTVPSFDNMTCGFTTCGSIFNYQRKGTSNHLWRDTDWYVFSIPSLHIVTATLDAEFPAIFAVVDTNGCVGPVALLADSNTTCAPITISDTLNAGTYTIAVMPKYFTGNPLPSQYRVTLACSCLVWPVDSVSTILVNADADAVANDMRIRFKVRQEMIDFGATCTIYYNSDLRPFPGNGWQQLVTGIVPSAPPASTYYDDLNVVNTTARRFYIVVGSCQ